MYRAALLVALVLAIAAALWGELNRREAGRQLDLVTAPRLAARAALLQQQSPRLAYQAALVALEAYARSPTLETDALLRKSVELLPRRSSEIKHDKKLFAAVFAGHDRLVFGGAEGIVKIKAWPDSQQPLTLEHERPVHGITTSADGAWIATREYRPKSIHIWNASSGTEHKVLQHAEYVDDVEFSHDSKQVLTYGTNIAATVWSLDTGEAVFQTDPEVGVRCAHFDAQGKQLITADRESRVRLWDIGSKTIVTEYAHDAWDCAISTDGEWMASGGNDGSITVSSTTDTASRSHYSIGHRVERLMFAMGDSLIASGGDAVHIRSARSGRSFVIDLEQMRATVYSSSSNRIATVARDLVQVWDASNSQEIARIPHAAWVKAIAFDASGRLLASVADNSVYIWDLASLNPFRHEGAVNDVVFSTDGARIISAGRDATARVWEVATGRELKRLDHEAPVWAVAASPDGSWFASGDNDGMARIWSTHDFKERARLAHAGEYVMFNVISLAVSPDSSLLASGTSNGWAYLWEIAYGLSREPLRVGNDVTGVAFSPDGNQLVTAAGSNARIWDAQKLNEISAFPHDHETLLDVAVDPSGAILATAARDGFVRLWDMAGGQLIGELAHDDSVRAVAFSTDGRYLASAANDRTVRVWDVQRGNELNRLLLGEPANAVAFSPDGLNLVTGDAGGSVRIWPLQIKALIADACARLARRLSETEVKTHLMGLPSLHPCDN